MNPYTERDKSQQVLTDEEIATWYKTERSNRVFTEMKFGEYRSLEKLILSKFSKNVNISMGFVEK